MVDATRESIAVGVGVAAKRVGVSRALLYGYVMSGELPSFTLGKRRLIAISALERWVAQQTSPVPRTGGGNRDTKQSQGIQP